MSETAAAALRAEAVHARECAGGRAGGGGYAVLQSILLRCLDRIE